jgi:hypothetical protein
LAADFDVEPLEVVERLVGELLGPSGDDDRGERRGRRQQRGSAAEELVIAQAVQAVVSALARCQFDAVAGRSLGDVATWRCLGSAAVTLTGRWKRC